MRVVSARLLSVVCAFVAACSVVPAGAEEFDLRGSRRKGDVARVELLLELAGDLKVVHEEKVKPVPLKVVGSANYREMLLEVPATAAGDARSVRSYEKLAAQIKIDDQRQDGELREECRTIGVEFANQETVYWNPASPLSREELDLLDIQGSSLLVDGLLPEVAVSLESTWQHEDLLIAALLGLDAVSANDVTSILKEVTPEAAKMELAGTVQGAVGGVSTEIEVKAKYKFDRASRRIVWFAMLLKEVRSIGHVGPGIDTVARLQMKVIPEGEADADLLAAAEEVRQSSPSDALTLGYRSTNGKFQFLYDRKWHVVNDEPELVVLRRVDRGELVAQGNVTPLAPAPADKPVTLAKFQEDIQKALGANFRQFAKAAEQSVSGRTIYRVVAVGEAAELPVEWHYYLVTDERGRQLSLVFTLEQPLAEKLGDADEQLAASVEFVDPVAESAEAPTNFDRQ